MTKQTIQACTYIMTIEEGYTSISVDIPHHSKMAIGLWFSVYLLADSKLFYNTEWCLQLTSSGKEGVQWINSTGAGQRETEKEREKVD